jgi:hypothetical protein
MHEDRNPEVSRTASDIGRDLLALLLLMLVGMGFTLMAASAFAAG